MDVALDQVVIAGLTVAGVLLSIAIPVACIVGLIWAAHRHLSGRRSRFDGLFTGIGRANAMNSHLQAGTPDPDELAVPLPPGWPRQRQRRRR